MQIFLDFFACILYATTIHHRFLYIIQNSHCFSIWLICILVQFNLFNHRLIYKNVFSRNFSILIKILQFAWNCTLLLLHIKLCDLILYPLIWLSFTLNDIIMHQAIYNVYKHFIKLCMLNNWKDDWNFINLNIIIKCIALKSICPGLN